MAVIPWVGAHRIAIVPVFDRQVDAEPPPDWENQIRSRVFYDPDPVTGVDRSFAHYLQALSYGQAYLEGEVFPPVWSDGPEVNIPAMRSLPDGHGYHDLMAVLPHSFGQHRGGHAFMDVAPVNGITSWARVAMFDDKFMTQRQPLGVWAMEVLHMVTRVLDLYNTNPNLGAFDVMADARATTHASAHTKTMMGWLPDGTVVDHVDGTMHANLHAIGLLQPPPPDRVTAVRVPSQLTANHFVVEARLPVDQYERKDGLGDGLPGDQAAPAVAKPGVIVYEVESPFSVFLRSGSALGPGEQYVNPDEGLQVAVEGSIPGGFTASISSPMRRLVDRSDQYHTPLATGVPGACVIPALGVHNIVYRDTSGHLHELWRDSQGQTGTTDLTAIAQAPAPASAGNPFTYVDTNATLELVLYRGTDGNVHSLYWSTGAVGHDNLSGAVGAPDAAGDPVGWFAPATNLHHVAYRTADGHLHVLWWQGAGAVGHEDSTALAGAPRAAGDPSGYVDTTRGDNILVYRGTDGRIHSLYWSTGPVGHDDLSGTAGTPAAAGDPVAYYTAHDDAHQVAYRGTNGHLYELWWVGVAPVNGWDLTAAAGAPLAASDPAVYYSAGTNTKHVIYRSADGHLHEIWWVPSGPPGHGDLTEFAEAPTAADQPAAFTVGGPNTQHVAYRGTDNHIHEIRWT